MKAIVGLVLVGSVCMLSGCATVIDTSKDLYDKYEQRQKEKEEAKRIKEQQEADSIKNEQEAAQAAKNAELKALAEKYGAGPSIPDEGRHGFIWKPKSDNDGYPVAILGERFTNKTPRTITVNGETWGRTSIGNVYREHFRGKVKKHFTGQVVIEVIATEGLNGTTKNKWTWIVPDASKRWDSNIVPTMTKM